MSRRAERLAGFILMPPPGPPLGFGMRDGTDEDGFELTQVKRVQVVGPDDINEKLLNGWLLLRILVKRVDGEEMPKFVIGRPAAETPKGS